MKSRFAIVVIFVLVVLAVVLKLRRPGQSIEPFVDFRGVNISSREAAIETEVVVAELAQYGPELVPALRAELHRGAWRQKLLINSITSKLPGGLLTRIRQAEFEQSKRAERAALTLGRLGIVAGNAVSDLKALVGTSAQPDDFAAEVALALIQRNDATVQSNALAALAAANQPRRVYFAKYANEIWPDRPDVLNKSLGDPDPTVRSFALYSLLSYGQMASNSIPMLVQMLSDKSATVRPRAALALGLISPEHADIAVTVMLVQQRTNNSWTGDQAHVLYQTVGPAARAAVPTLEAELADSSHAMFHGDAAGALWRITGNASPEIVAGLGTGIRIGVQRTQLRCLRIIQEIGPPAAATAPALCSLTNHPRLLIRQLASEALESVNRPPVK
jgi:HEAT repeat protein